MGRGRTEQKSEEERERERERRRKEESGSRILGRIRIDDISPPRGEYLQPRVKEERAHLQRG